ncbi:pancreatic lipase-related protein 2-like [Phymastichus coffea]|uniref:pancreatic lipase-related protein 2-like n=1 Tax=Phymastichus coffea TaxID=108790 RepID=UPI00273C2E3D|nr:pancreatic lipase-related protein 2-like [Phymastichus coffea]
MDNILTLLIEFLLRMLWISWAVTPSMAWESGLKEKYDGYGEDWIFMPDGKEQPQVAVLKIVQSDNRGVLDEPIGFILYTRADPEKGVHLNINDLESLTNSDFSPDRPTKFITHGWKSSAFSASIINMKKEYLINGDYNVILVNWEPMAASTFYLGPMRNTGKVGAKAAQFIDFLVRETGISTDRIHFIGHSLGAHVAGNTGEQVTSGKMGRITGLDPALPGFHVLTMDKGRLDPSDALYVDVIHSCGGVLGYLQPLGHTDFYPNAGIAVQPGCCCVPELIEACSHGRAYHYFTESINSRIGLIAKPCETWDKYLQGECDNNVPVLLGEHVDKSARGSHFLRTRSEPPFAYTEDFAENEV